MKDSDQDKVQWLDKLRNQYRLVVFSADTFKEVRAFDLSLASIYSLISIISIVLIISFYALFAFTPLKTFIPGYGDIESNADMIQFIEKVDQISEELNAQDKYISAISAMLTIPDIEDVPQKVNQRSERVSTIDSPRKTLPSPQKKTVPIKNVSSTIYDTWLSAEVIMPVQGIVSSRFMPEIKHYGVDILAPANSPINVIMDGYVFSSGWDLETGYTIGVQHEGNILSFYKHNSILLKEKGTFVQAGEAIAIIGNTGTLSSGPHLHFELWHSGKPLNPEDFLNFK